MDENAEATLATAARLLLHRDQTEAASLLIEVKNLTWTWTNSSGRTEMFHVDMEVDFPLLDRGDDVVLGQIADAMTTALMAIPTDDGGRNQWEGVSSVGLVPSLLTDADWRTDVQAVLSGRPNNQAALVALPDRFPNEDRMRFRDMAELHLYRALKRAQGNLPGSETITIVPGPSVRIPAHTWEPDFVIAYKGRVGIIEVDGRTHVKKWSSDRSRDRLFEDAGVSYVDHIEAADTDGPGVDQFVERFLRRLGGT